MFARVCRFGHIGGQNETRARRRGRLLRKRRLPWYRRVSDDHNLRVAVSNKNIRLLSHRPYIIIIIIIGIILFIYKNHVSMTQRCEQFEQRIGVDEG